jgi:hypothetical protein
MNNQKILNMFNNMSDIWPNEDMVILGYDGKDIEIYKNEQAYILKYMGIISWINITHIYNLYKIYYNEQKANDPVLEITFFIKDCLLKEGFPYKNYYKKYLERKLKFKNIIE